MGSGYVIEHCVSAFSQRNKEKAFRIYMTDAIMCISETVANMGNGGSYMEKRYIDIIEPQDDEFDPDEIALDIIQRAGLRTDNECS